MSKYNHHGMTHTRLYQIYINMIQRCYNPKNKGYKNYHDRGIVVCGEWRNDSKSFLDWALKNGYNDTLTLDRIDSNKGYSPDNCRWVDRFVQNNNTRRNFLLLYNNKWLTIKQIAQIENIPLKTAYNRYVAREKHRLPRKQLY